MVDLMSRVLITHKAILLATDPMWSSSTLFPYLCLLARRAFLVFQLLHTYFCLRTFAFAFSLEKFFPQIGSCHHLLISLLNYQRGLYSLLCLKWHLHHHPFSVVTVLLYFSLQDWHYFICVFIISSGEFVLWDQSIILIRCVSKIYNSFWYTIGTQCGRGCSSVVEHV